MRSRRTRDEQTTTRTQGHERSRDSTHDTPDTRWTRCCGDMRKIRIIRWQLHDATGMPPRDAKHDDREFGHIHREIAGRWGIPQVIRKFSLDNADARSPGRR